MFELQIEGMTCGGCANSVKKAIQAVDSSAQVQVDLANKKVQVETASGIEVIRAAVVQAGYPVGASREL